VAFVDSASIARSQRGERERFASLMPAFTASFTRAVTSSMLIRTFSSRLGHLELVSPRLRDESLLRVVLLGVLTSVTKSSTM
jgi:hypothetical protein